MKKINLIAFIVIILLAGCQEDSFITDYQLPSENMVLVEGGTYMMGDWMKPYYLSDLVSEGDNVKDLTYNLAHGNDFTFDARKTHQVTVDSFYISKYEITFELYDRYCYETSGILNHDGYLGSEDDPSISWGRGNMPAIYIKWSDAIKFCNWLSIKEGFSECYSINNTFVQFNKKSNGYRLPTEAEWEYAARGGHLMSGNGTIYSGCDDITGMFEKNGIETDIYGSADSDSLNNQYITLKDYAWFNLTSGWVKQDYDMSKNGSSHPVGQKLPNALGIYDMSGNVWEWCWDWYSPDYYTYCTENESECDNPMGPIAVGDKGAVNCHTLRGGSWGNYPVFVRTTFRFFSKKQVLTSVTDPTFEYSSWRTGMRLARSVK